MIANFFCIIIQAFTIERPKLNKILFEEAFIIKWIDLKTKSINTAKFA